MRTSSLDSGSLLTSVRSVRSVESLSFHLLVGRLVKRRFHVLQKLRSM